MNDVPPYSILAAGYDAVMEHVDYDYWARHAHDLVQAHSPEAERLLELGCGTGSLALALQPLGPYRYLATDRSPQMIHVARLKAQEHDATVRFDTADFTDFTVDEPVDAVVLLYDGLNYVLEEERLRGLMQSSYEALRPGGIFLFDQSTPYNSLRNEADFEDERQVDGFYFRRRSRYDAEQHLHTTTFDIEYEGHRFREEHVQRAYGQDTIRTHAEAVGFEVEAAYDDFTTLPAREDSERVHWVVRR